LSIPATWQAPHPPPGTGIAATSPIAGITVVTAAG
jgi:hypothetical protein